MELEKVKEYLRIDYDDENIFIQSLIDTAQIYIDECVGVAYKNYQNLVNLAEIAQLKLISDIYENRTANIAEKRDIVITTIFDKLSMAGDV